MNPIEPSGDPVHFEPIPHPPVPRDPFFDYTDLFIFTGLCIPSLFLALLLVHIVKIFAPMPTTVQLLLVQTIWYFFVFGLLAALFRMRYEKPFWQSLGWRSVSIGAGTGGILAGPLLAISIGLIASALHTPEINLPFEQMLGSTGTIVLLGLLVVILGPVAEELAFRGLLMPLLIRSLGPAAGIVLTGLIFGSVHGYEYQWSWQYMLLISLAGCVFGWAKYKTRSTVTGALMHSTFNLAQFAAFLLQQRSL
jgi:membrane protease YdiL (CAAX protease family)